MRIIEKDEPTTFEEPKEESKQEPKEESKISSKETLYKKLLAEEMSENVKLRKIISMLCESKNSTLNDILK